MEKTDNLAAMKNFFAYPDHAACTMHSVPAGYNHVGSWNAWGRQPWDGWRAGRQGGSMSIRGKRIAILLAQQYEDAELWYPYYRFQEEGARVTLVAAKADETYPSKHGYPARSDVAAADVKASDFDAIIVPGGFAPDFMRREQSMLDFISDAADGEMVLASICHGAWLLCTTDVFKGRKATSFFAIRWDVMNAGAKWLDQEVVVDDRLVTSRCPADLPAFCKSVIQLIEQRTNVPSGL